MWYFLLFFLKTNYKRALDWEAKSGSVDDKDEFDLRLVSSNDLFATAPRVRIEHAVDFLVDWQDEFMLVAVLRGDESGELQLYASPDLGKSFTAARFPDELDEQFYTFLDHTGGVVFVHVRDHIASNGGSVFVSDALGFEFSLALPQVSVENYQVEFRRLRGIEGVYVANQLRVPDDWLAARVMTVLSQDKGATWNVSDLFRDFSLFFFCSFSSD